MSKKGFLVKVELDIQKVTCPGVWLCSNGRVSLQIHMLDSSVQTKSTKPSFPIMCYEKFVFSKVFENVHRLNDLQRSLGNEWFYSELIQWKTCDEGCVLATFQNNLDDLLYPISYRNAVTGMDVDLLMEPTRLFPGTLSPKLEVSTKTTIEEIVCDFNAETREAMLVNPRALLSNLAQRKSQPRRVCHTVAFSRAQRNAPAKSTKCRPIFKYRKPSDDLILRNNPNVVLRDDGFCKKRCGGSLTNVTCYCRSSRINEMRKKLPKYNLEERRSLPDSICGKDLHRDNCSICSTYESYFSMKNSKSKNNELNDQVPPRLCQFCKNHLRKYHLKSRDNSPFSSDVSERSNKVCFCVSERKAHSLAQHLHEKLSQTLDTNNRFFRNCIDCEGIRH